jgi:NAD(P)-dependent dehydrogenase (short-subunit alcohol dehydrogenase family)
LPDGPPSPTGAPLVAPVALVTGAGSGIGRLSALALAEAGFVLVLAGRRLPPLTATAKAIESAGGTALGVVTDVSVEASVERLFSEVRGTFGRLDVLFNNAGVSPPPVSLADVDKQDWDQAVAINLTGAFLCTRAAFKLMRDQLPRGGRIINNGSISASVPRPGSVAYTATKHAITGLTKATSLDGRRYDIACGQIDIGNASTEMTSPMAVGVEQADGSVRPEPTMDAAHVARAVVYMATLPLGANVQFITVMATGMPFIGRG